MLKVAQLLEVKGSQIWSISPEDTVFEAIRIMDEKGIGALTVMQDGELVGILSERDYARKVILKDRSSKETLVKEIMTRDVYYTLPEQDVEACLAVMTERRIRHLPVISEDKVIGMISMGDVVKEIIADQKYMLEQLEHSISWGESY